MVTNFQIWVYRGMRVLFLLENYKFVLSRSKTHYWRQFKLFLNNETPSLAVSGLLDWLYINVASLYSVHSLWRNPHVFALKEFSMLVWRINTEWALLCIISSFLTKNTRLGLCARWNRVQNDMMSML